jgi:hypothetical protein
MHLKLVGEIRVKQVIFICNDGILGGRENPRITLEVTAQLFHIPNLSNLFYMRFYSIGR